MTIVELEFICDSCSRPVANGDGSVFIWFVDLHDRRRQLAEWERIHGGDSSAVDLADLLTHPDDVQWRIRHYDCEPDDSDGYHIDVEHVRTWRGLVEWTSHLMEKNWLQETTWGALLGSAARGTDRHIRAVSLHGDAA